jgi:hypothetical protein
MPKKQLTTRHCELATPKKQLTTRRCELAMPKKQLTMRRCELTKRVCQLAMPPSAGRLIQEAQELPELANGCQPVPSDAHCCRIHFSAR